MKTIYLYLLEGMAEWEIGYILQAISMESQLKKGEKEFEIKTVSYNNEPIHTLGGLTIIPDCTLEEMNESQMAALLLPGANTWNSSKNIKILQKVIKYLEKGIIVGAICGATLALADIEILNKYKHTSNSLDYLKFFSKQYKGAPLYCQCNSCIDKNLITANSASGLLWAKNILLSLQVYSSKTLESWYNYYLTGNPQFYDELLSQED